MSTLKTFAVAGGTGSSPIALGPSVVEGLLKAGAIVKVLARVGSSASPAAEKLKALGATIVEVDYDKPATLQAALEGIDAVVSTIGGLALASQVPLAEAAAKAGVKIFVPSEFGNPTVNEDGTERDLATMGPMRVKVELHQTLRDLKLPYLLIFTGVFADAVKTGEKTSTVIGDGTQEISWTARADIGDFVGKALTTVPLSRLSNGTLRFEGSRISPNDLLVNRGYQIKYDSTAIAYKRWESNSDTIAWLKARASEGWALASKEKDKLDNSLVPGWKPKHVSEFI